jgi:group II intron reverse transcriptase/maturase
VFIPKADGRQRPLGIAALEDKIVQQAVVTILNCIYEKDFRGFSYGFRPGRSQHQALDALYVGLRRRKVSWVLDADIRGFFDNLDRGWLVKFLQHRVADRRVLRLIQKWLDAGVMEEGEWKDTERGTPQGSVISPLLANVYLHYVFDLWVDAWRKKVARGEVIVVRYADDNVLGFQYRDEADRFLEDFRERLRKFGLELHPDKTRRIEFGRFAQQNRKRRGEGKPETFDFLGFTHICAKNRNGSYAVKRHTISKRLRAKLAEIKLQLRLRKHEPVVDTGKWLKSVVQGYFNYYAVPGNLDSLGLFRARVIRLWRRVLIQRSQRHKLNWILPEQPISCHYQTVLAMAESAGGNEPPSTHRAFGAGVGFGWPQPQDSVALIADLLQLPVGERYPAVALTPEQRRRRLLAALTGWVFGAARLQAVLIVVEDLHWLDPSSLELVQLLTEQAVMAPVMLICTARPEFHPQWPMRSHHTQITLNRLDTRNVREMITPSCGAECPRQRQYRSSY